MKNLKRTYVAMIAALFAFYSCDNDETIINITEGGTTTTPSGTEIEVTGAITSDTTWAAGNEYILTTRVYVEEGVTLTIEPGVVVKGGAGQGVNSRALVVRRGATIMAEGTSARPIIFTSVGDEITSADVLAGNIISPNLDESINGQWGGLVILGRAPISAQNESDEDVAELDIEGIPATENPTYGGADPMDNSGVLRYISIRHGGTDIGSGNEINGLTLGGVGNGTTIEFIEVVANQDDGIEWFGGTVDVTNAIVWNNGDDAYDTDQAWSGTLDNFVAVTPGGNALELDGPEGTANGSHTLRNGWISNPGGRLAQLDANSQVSLENILFLNLVLDADNLPTQTIDRTVLAPDVSFTNVLIDVPTGGMLNDFIEDGDAPAGITAGTTNTVDTSAFSNWSWAGSVLGF